MIWKISLIVLLALPFVFIASGYSVDEAKPVSASNTSAAKKAFIGWVDQNKDGINDKFRDSNGDGINDVTNEKYDHRLSFVDRNKDGINDVFVDNDGDGVNDRGTKFIDRNKDGINDNILDYNKDGINDITGQKYQQNDLMGYRYGIVEEELKKTHKKCIDNNNDGMNDPVSRRMRFHDEDADGINDRFVDKDGDGICDGRRFGQRMHGRGQQSEQQESAKGKKNRFGRGGGSGGGKGGSSGGGKGK